MQLSDLWNSTLLCGFSKNCEINIQYADQLHVFSSGTPLPNATYTACFSAVKLNCAYIWMLPYSNGTSDPPVDLTSNLMITPMQIAYPRHQQTPPFSIFLAGIYVLRMIWSNLVCTFLVALLQYCNRRPTTWLARLQSGLCFNWLRKLSSAHLWHRPDYCFASEAEHWLYLDLKSPTVIRLQTATFRRRAHSLVQFS